MTSEDVCGKIGSCWDVAHGCPLSASLSFLSVRSKLNEMKMNMVDSC